MPALRSVISPIESFLVSIGIKKNREKKRYSNSITDYMAVYRKEFPKRKERARASTCFWSIKDEILYVSCPTCSGILSVEKDYVHPFLDTGYYRISVCIICHTCRSHAWWILKDYEKVMENEA